MQDRRSEVRLLCADMVDVTWQDSRGRTRRVPGVLEDISPSGACVQLESPLEPGLPVGIGHPQGRLDGVVRYCVYRDIGYFVGVRFEPESQWSRGRFEPQHLLDLDEWERANREGGKEPN